MKWNVIFAHKLRVGHVASTLIGPPPAFPIGTFARINPLLCAGNIFNRGVEPNVENFAFHARPIVGTFFDGDTPIKVTGDAAVLQSVAVGEPFFGN